MNSAVILGQFQPLGKCLLARFPDPLTFGIESGTWLLPRVPVSSVT